MCGCNAIICRASSRNDTKPCSVTLLLATRLKFWIGNGKKRIVMAGMVDFSEAAGYPSVKACLSPRAIA